MSFAYDVTNDTNTLLPWCMDDLQQVSCSELAMTVTICFRSFMASRDLLILCSGCCCQPSLELGWSLACCSAQPRS